MEAYSPSSRKKRKDPNAPKQPLSAYFIFQTEIRDQVKSELQNPTIYDVAKEVGRRWADMAPEVKQRYAHMAEMGRRKYDQGPFTNDVRQRFLFLEPLPPPFYIKV